MTWREDRDALIADTMAFVQSVTGKPVDLKPLDLNPVDLNPADLMQFAGSLEPPVGFSASPGGMSSAPDPSSLADTPAATFAVNDPGQAVSQTTDRQTTAEALPTEVPPHLASGPEAVDAEAIEQADPQQAGPQMARTDLASDLFRTQPLARIGSPLDLQRDMQSEIRARVASFRAHQERFNRERQEYFSATLARLKALTDQALHPDD
jgi:hypothetical protein